MRGDVGQHLAAELAIRGEEQPVVLHPGVVGPRPLFPENPSRTATSSNGSRPASSPPLKDNSGRSTRESSSPKACRA